MARLAVVLLLLLLMASCCLARDFYVGGQDGWATKPAEPYNHWAERNRFLVNDRLVFRYRKDSDSVLVVSPSHYDACNNTEPYLRLDGGDSVFVLGHSGPFFFISGDRQRCQDGERLIVVVLAERQKGGAPPDRPSPPPPLPSQSPPPPAPPVPAPAPRHMTPPPPPSNSSSPSSAPAQAPPAVEAPPPGKNGTSSASSVLSSGVLAYVVASGAIILVEAFLG